MSIMKEEVITLQDLKKETLKNITKLKKEDNSEITEKEQILNELASFYQKLYSNTEYCNIVTNMKNVFLQMIFLNWKWTCYMW